jgi:hypothetical protein
MAPQIGANNHVEMVHRPGEADLAHKLLELLGCEPAQLDVGFAGGIYQHSGDGNLWVSEVTPGQWGFELWLQERLATGGSAKSDAFVKDARATPQKFSHFGVGVQTLAAWEAIVARLSDAIANDPQLAGRTWLALVARPGEEGSVARLTGGKAGAMLYQAFLRTDIISAGLLTLGQSIEIQHSRDNDPDYGAGPEPKVGEKRRS